MARTNLKVAPVEFTHEGAPARTPYAPLIRLRRSVLSCLLWEKEFYEDGESIADRILSTCRECNPVDIAQLAIETRTQGNLRHVPLLLLIGLMDSVKARGTGIVNNPSLIADTIFATIQRPDDMGELLALWNKVKGANAAYPAQLKKGLARAFVKFDAYSLAKYNADSAEFKLRDVMFLSHPRPKDVEQENTFRALAAKTLPPPDTWEVALSSGADKKETFTRLLTEGKLGYLALLRNLRNMEQAGVDPALISQAILARKRGAERVLPFRYIAAARYAPNQAAALDEALLASLEDAPTFPGKTIVLVDISGSMQSPLSARSDLTREDAAAALASIIKADQLRIVAFSRGTYPVNNLRGLAGIDAIKHLRADRGATYLGEALKEVMQHPHDRLIVITDEQSHDAIPDPVLTNGQAYMINVASYRQGVGYRKWVHLDGFSENVLRFIHAHEHEAGYVATNILGG